MTENPWEEAFQSAGTMWGERPTKCAEQTAGRFAKRGVKSVLIPGVGYGRNALPFLARGMDVTGVEISASAIAMARDELGLTFPIHHGSVVDEPGDGVCYDAVFCHGLLYLLDDDARLQALERMFARTNRGGVVVTTWISRDAPMYGKGRALGPHRFELHEGMAMTFHDESAVKNALAQFGATETEVVAEPGGGGTHFPFVVARSSVAGQGSSSGSQTPESF